jgi:hypothetical protein
MPNHDQVVKSDFEKSFLAFVSELDLVLVINADASARMEREREIDALRGQLASVEERMEQAFKMLDPAPAFVQTKLGKLELERIATNATLEAKERELHAFASTVISKDQLHEAIARLQGGDYKLRAEVMSHLKSIMSSLYVGTVGWTPLIAQAKDLLAAGEEDMSIEFMAEMPDNDRRFFAVTFRTDERRVAPNRDNPMEYEQMVSTTDGEVGALSINLEEFHQLLADHRS